MTYRLVYDGAPQKSVMALGTLVLSPSNKVGENGRISVGTKTVRGVFNDANLQIRLRAEKTRTALKRKIYEAVSP